MPESITCDECPICCGEVDEAPEMRELLKEDDEEDFCNNNNNEYKNKTESETKDYYNMNVEELVDKAKQLTIKEYNYEALIYANKAIEKDKTSSQAFFIKSVILFNNSYANPEKMLEATNIAIKSYNLGTDSEKQKIKETVISGLVESKLDINNIDCLFKIFDEFGSNDLRLILYIINIIKKNYFETVIKGNIEKEIIYKELITNAFTKLQTLAPKEFDKVTSDFYRELETYK